MNALRITDPYDPEPAAAPVPQLAWPQRAPREPADGDRTDAERTPPSGGDRCWRRFTMPARAPA